MSLPTISYFIRQKASISFCRIKYGSQSFIAIADGGGMGQKNNVWELEKEGFFEIMANIQLAGQR
ncbi:hypothetical protein ETC05_00410 [Geobacillus sp. BMUD]|nr:hypothetical protein [Geobacillus sp. BMUD]